MLNIKEGKKMRTARHILQNFVSVFTALYSLGGPPTIYSSVSAHSLTNAAWRQAGRSLRVALEEADAQLIKNEQI
ncbi:hypothetical protein GS501_04535 [Saccharibacter sp. 17.LH.SD]|uniref:hypothetical protein n=1 Tax=Saccharibacter sp. 17.LH.SD TaxID=2689393 RepID=UPI001371B0C1|nr:hypothetical protein [Saccharibacter sp. 17.LH.SD]MXV44312.1 hypothetical protein [Saccharibacter sp. 17.LH.SD]